MQSRQRRALIRKKAQEKSQDLCIRLRNPATFDTGRDHDSTQDPGAKTCKCTCRHQASSRVRKHGCNGAHSSESSSPCRTLSRSLATAACRAQHVQAESPSSTLSAGHGCKAKALRSARETSRERHGSMLQRHGNPANTTKGLDWKSLVLSGEQHA